MKFTKGEKAEIKDLYDGSWASIRELALSFECSTNKIKYLVNKKYRILACEYARQWQKRNPERTREINNKAVLKWYHKKNDNL